MDQAAKPSKPAAKAAPAAKPIPKPVAIKGIHGVGVTFDQDGRVLVTAQFHQDAVVRGESGETAPVRRLEGLTPYAVISGGFVAEVRTGIMIEGEIGHWQPRLPSTGEVVIEDVTTNLGELVVTCRAFGLDTATLEQGTVLASVEVVKK